LRGVGQRVGCIAFQQLLRVRFRITLWCNYIKPMLWVFKAQCVVVRNFGCFLIVHGWLSSFVGGLCSALAVCGFPTTGRKG
jgi:hypothetical protein